MTRDCDIVEELVAANRILAGLGVVDGFGHVSVRQPGHPDRYLLSRSLAPLLVTRQDIIEYRLDSVPADGDTRTGYLERFIHGEIYARRPDIQAVVHSHADAVVPFAVSRVALRPVFHMSSFLRSAAPVFEIREKFGATDMLVRDAAQGAALAEALGSGPVVLMRGHGYCTVGATLPLAVFRAYYTQVNAELQQRAIALSGSGVLYLSEAEAALSEQANASVANRTWELWRQRFRGPGG